MMMMMMTMGMGITMITIGFELKVALDHYFLVTQIEVKLSKYTNNLVGY